VDQFKGTDSGILRILDMKFILHSIGRMPTKDRREVIPSILRGIARADIGDTSTDRLVNLIFRILPDIKIPPAGTEAAARFRGEVGLSDPADSSALAEWFGRLLLLTFRTRPAAPDGGFGGQPATIPGREEPVVGEGLSPRDVELLTLGGDAKTWDPKSPEGLSLLDTRLKVMAFLSSAAFSDEDRFLPALYAAGHPDKRISGLGDDLLKKSGVSLEDAPRIRRLFHAHAELSSSYRTRILTLLSKSSVSVTFSADILRAVDRDIHAEVQSLELKKLHRALLEYISWVARIGPTTECGVALISHLKTYIADQGWPVPNAAQDELLGTLRARAYESIGMLAGGTKMAASDRLELTQWLFQSLARDPVQQVVVSVDGALSSLASGFKPPLDGEVEEQLKTLLLAYMTLHGDDAEDAPRNVRHAAAKWANQCLPFSNPTARWIDILAVAGRQDERSDVVEEGKKGLDPWTYLADTPTTTGLPEWQELVRFFFEEAIPQARAPASREMDVDRAPTMVNFPESRFPALPLAIGFCQRMLFLGALPDFKIEPGWERELEAAVYSNKSNRDTIRRYVAEHSGAALSTLLSASFEGAMLPQLLVAEDCLRSFVSLASLCRRGAIANLAFRAKDLLPLTRSNRKETRSLASKALGILGAHPSNTTKNIEDLKSSLSARAQTWQTAAGAEMNAAEGAFLALGYLVSRLVYYSPERASKLTEDVFELIPEPQQLAEAPASFQAVVFEAMVQWWTAGVPALPVSPKRDDAIVALLDLVADRAKKSSELAITATGRMTLALDLASEDGADGAKPLAERVLDKLYGLHEIKQAEVHFAIGEAIAAVVARWDSDALQLSLDVDSEDRSYQRGRRSDLMTKVLSKILSDCKTTKPALLKASGIWLFCLVQHCSHLPEIQSQLRQCQDAFMRLLSARDELVQETASRGLSLVYEKGDESLKGALVRDLVAAFTGSGPQLKVDDDTELFDAGALPTSEGKSVTSYKDIVNLANEVGDQTLVYKFMSLATNAATWSTRSAFGRFGLSTILSESEIDPKLYPKLYRYRFDPNPNVRKSMNDIWDALVKDSNAVWEAHFDAVMEDLMKNILGREWRVREASCSAVSDLVQARPFTQYEKYYGDIWAHAAKVLDDIKGSVRTAAYKLCMTLSKTLVRQLEEGSKGAAASAMMKQALDFLMSEKGIESSVEDVKLFSTITVLDIAKHGGKALRPFIPTMIPQLLGLLGTIEGNVVNYAYQRANEEGREKIDRARSSAVSRSPITEAVENLLRNVDGPVMAELAPGLEGAIKTALALPTKIGCARVLSTLATRHAADFEPFSAGFLALMRKQVLDRNDEVSTNYARAAAYIVRVAPDQARRDYVVRLIDLYFTAEDEVRRQKVGDAHLALAQLSPDHFNALEGYLLPFAYLGSHDTDDYVRKEYTEIWNKHAGSALSILRYVPEIVGLVERALDIQQVPPLLCPSQFHRPDAADMILHSGLSNTQER